MEDEDAGRCAETIAREIVRRWLGNVSPELWRHQGRHHYWAILTKHGRWLPVNEKDPNSERRWVPYPPKKVHPESPCAVEMHHFEGGVCRECGAWQNPPKQEEA
jgi:hypothetical protein